MHPAAAFDGSSARRGLRSRATPFRSTLSDGMFGQECEYKARDFVVFLIQGEMAGVELMDFGIRQVALERRAAGRDERGIVPPPNHQGRRLVLAQPRLPRRIRSNVLSVVVEQTTLDLT